MKFRKKPVIIEAFRFLTDPMPDWFMDRISDNTIVLRDTFCTIKTLEGPMIATCDDYIIQGVQGEIYPCKYNIFTKTYEAVE